MPTHHKGTESETRALNAFIKLMRATESVSSRLTNILQGEGLTISQFGVLEALLHLGPLSLRQIGEKILKSGGNITTVVDNLEKHDLVERRRCPEDRRAPRATQEEAASGDKWTSSPRCDHSQPVSDKIESRGRNYQEDV